MSILVGRLSQYTEINHIVIPGAILLSISLNKVLVTMDMKWSVHKAWFFIRMVLLDALFFALLALFINVYTEDAERGATTQAAPSQVG
ncbi:hypothetical protein AB6D11_00630 [Vibrio splendidus]